VDIEDLLACPSCQGTLTADWSCLGCNTSFDAPDDIPDLRAASDARTETVRRFYEGAPFPGYPPNDSVEWLRARAERSESRACSIRPSPVMPPSSTSDAEQDR
jgi:uncharacterized protein YbaR (Trm112 family)